MPVAKVVASDAKPMLIAYPTFVGIIMAGYASEVPDGCLPRLANLASYFGMKSPTSGGEVGLRRSVTNGLGSRLQRGVGKKGDE